MTSTRRSLEPGHQRDGVGRDVTIDRRHVPGAPQLLVEPADDLFSGHPTPPAWAPWVARAAGRCAAARPRRSRTPTDQPPAAVPALIGVAPMLVPLGALTSPVGDSVPPGAGVSSTPESEQATIASRQRHGGDRGGDRREHADAGRLVGPSRRLSGMAGEARVAHLSQLPRRRRPNHPGRRAVGVTSFTACRAPRAGTIAGP